MRFPVAATLVTVLGCVHAAPAPDALRAGELSPSSILGLREQGPAGLNTILAALDAATEPAVRARLIDAITGVAGQKDAHVSRLYWYEDLDDALAAAKLSGKPVLSLRMLGRLDEELSCANSRFFRTTLYGNTAVSSFLRERFVLHWSSERPVPVVSIDFGDGRKVTRTITGNSVHYVLDARGNVVDALPGLYSAQAFLETLQRSEEIAKVSGRLDGVMRAQAVQTWHEEEIRNSLRRYQDDLAKVGIKQISYALPTVPGLQITDVWPSSRVAVPMAMGKAVVELPMVKQLVPDGGAKAPIDPTPWERIASARKSQLDASSRALVLSKNPVDVTSPQAPRLSPALAIQMIERLEQSIDVDTARNEYALHAVIHLWLSENPGVAMKDFNREVYARLFLTPATDPWLGLVPALAWTGLPNDGIEITQR